MKRDEASEDRDVSDARLVRALLHTQRLVAERTPLERIYQTVLDGAIELMEADHGSLRFVDPNDPAWMVAVATCGVAGNGERWRARSPITEGISGRVISTGEPVALADLDEDLAGSRLAPEHSRATLGVPIREGRLVVGSLLIGVGRPRRWTPDEVQRQISYAQHVGPALAVARSGHAVRQALTDSLTGLGNRALLLDRIEHELVRADRGGEPVTVLFLDLDRFKTVNDTLGHMIGDELLVEVADRLRRCLRADDLCTRLGGDEFAVLLAGRSDPVMVAERIIATLERTFVIDGHDLQITVSIGIATGRDQADTLLGDADAAMYSAKRSCSGRYEFAQPSAEVRPGRPPALDVALGQAVVADQLELLYQPQLDVRTGALWGFEALLRWRHPARGLLEPAQFLPLARELGLMPRIGRWVLEQACVESARWWTQQPISLSVNVSDCELRQPGFGDLVGQAIAGRFPPSALVLELTDGLPERRETIAELHAMAALGVRLALDDFGAGPTPLLGLREAPLHLIKLARPVLDGVGRDGHDPSGLVPGILALGRSLGLTTVAQGVERPEQLSLVTALGCDLAQGHLLGRPLDAAGARERLRAEGDRADRAA